MLVVLKNDVLLILDYPYVHSSVGLGRPIEEGVLYRNLVRHTGRGSQTSYLII